ncbi:MAG: thiazole synthase [Turneriella sp.]|nr:thiazole synthase [Turneriella sp.]
MALGSRLIVGTGRYRSLEEMRACHEAAQTEMVTVALRRVELRQNQQPLLDYIDLKKITLLPNTSGSAFAADALRQARLAAAMGNSHLKVEICGDVQTLLPDPIETLKAVELIKKNSDTRHLYLMVYTNDDPVLARRLADAGADCIMPAASPIGSGRGISNESNLIILLSMMKGRLPVIIDAGIGTPSHAARAMELGADGVLMNTAIARAKNPVLMAEAMRDAVKAGRAGFLAGTIKPKLFGTASSPTLF